MQPARAQTAIKGNRRIAWQLDYMGLRKDQWPSPFRDPPPQDTRIPSVKARTPDAPTSAAQTPKIRAKAHIADVPSPDDPDFAQSRPGQAEPRRVRQVAARTAAAASADLPEPPRRCSDFPLTQGNQPAAERRDRHAAGAPVLPGRGWFGTDRQKVWCKNPSQTAGSASRRSIGLVSGFGRQCVNVLNGANLATDYP